MTENKPTARTPSRLLDVKKQTERVPLIRRNAFVYGFLAALILYAVFILPPSGSLTSIFQMAVVVLFVLLCFAWTVLILTDELKPKWMKTVSAFALLGVFGWLFYRYSEAQWGDMIFLFFNVEIIQKAWPTLTKGFWTTIQLAISVAVLSTVLGLIIAVFRSFNNRILNIFIIAYVDFFRAMPIIVLLIIIYYALPFLGIRLDAMLAGIIGLGLNSSAYVSEIFRSGIQSVKKGQIEAAHALGLNAMQTMRLVLLPQALRVVMPPLVGNYVASAKDTALCSSISIIELLKAGLSEQSLLANPSPLIFSTALYLAMFVPLTRLSSVLEVRMKAGVRKINV